MEKDSLFKKWYLINERATCKRLKVHKSVHCVTMSKIERTFIIVWGVVLTLDETFLNNFIYGPILTSVHDHWKNFVGKVMSLLFNMLSRLVIAFLPRSKHLLISWLYSPSAIILEPNKIKSARVSILSLSICHEVMGPDAMILVFWMLSFKPTYSFSSFTFIKRLFSSLLSA